MAEQNNTNWEKLLVPDPKLKNLTNDTLLLHLYQYADWVEGGDPNYIENLYAVAFEQGRRTENLERYLGEA